MSISQRERTKAQQTLERETERELTALMAQYKTSLMRMAYMYLGDITLAEDAVQETFLKAYYHLSRFRGDA